MLRSYLDASQRDSGIYCVAAVAFGLDRAKKANREWSAIFGDRPFHMTDLHARRRAFSGISDQEAGDFCKAAVSIVKKYASLIACISCDSHEVARLIPDTSKNQPEMLRLISTSTYTCCLHWAMSATGRLLRDSPQKIQFWFETGDQHQGDARQWLSTINQPYWEEIRQLYCYSTDAFVSKADAPLFGAADLVAWEWGKHIDRIRERKAIRPSLTALMNGPCIYDGQPYCQSDTRLALHYTGQSLENYFNKMGRLIRATSFQEVADAVRPEPS